MKKLIVLAGAVVFASANAIVIDDFTTGPYTNMITGGSVIVSQLGTMAGLQRDTMLTVINNPFNQPLQITIAGGMNIVNNGTLTVGRVGLDYDGVDVENPIGTTFNQGPGMNRLDLTGQSLIFNFLANDRTLNLNVNVQTLGPDGGSSSGNFVIAGNQDVAFTYTVPMTALTGGATVSAIDRLTVYFVTSPSGDFGLSGIGTSGVPEPASVIAIATGLALLAARRRRR